MSQPQERPSQVEVPLADGRKMTVRELTWGAYRRLKLKVASTAADRLLTAFTAGSLPTDKEAVLNDSKFLSTAVASLIEAADDLTPELVAGCCDVKADQVESMRPADVLSLRNAAAQVNDLEKIFGLEKNGLAAAIKKLQTIVADFGGGWSSNPSSPPPMDGVEIS